MHVGAHKEVTEADVAMPAAEEQVTVDAVAPPAAGGEAGREAGREAAGREAELLATKSSWHSRSPSHQLKTAPRSQ
jgi:hypothetical protein